MTVAIYWLLTLLLTSSLFSSPAGLLAPADVYSSADHEWPTAELATSRPLANFSRQSLAAGSIRNAAFQLNETTSLHFYDWFPKPAAVAMVHMPSRQSQGFAVPLIILLEKVVKADLGEPLKLHPLKVLNNKSVLTYMKKNPAVVQASESSKASGTQP
ncbi:hypothetical protein F511_17211 [Dorcoceras hygrometricum]|uniref:Uncharacterized protein n=1 Tax=Dorcoceras hygrometricum TaxID=472368 RepID=A0A2Z7B6X0_9LAMI|nr:hypothetical protein F511_17211 [Dorcoceras hygrometricum]